MKIKDDTCDSGEAFTEVEVKFLLDHFDTVVNSLEQRGAASRGRVFEDNTLYDDQAGSLRKSGCLLRLRRDGRCRLTFKAPADNPDPAFKKSREWEVEVSDPEAMEGILTGMGFQPVRRYQKYRTTYNMGSVECVLDEMPFGRFMELEGPPEDIRAAARNLGLAWEERITKNYLSVFSVIQKKEGWTFDDVTFENFAGVEVNALKHLPLLAAGKEG